MKKEVFDRLSPEDQERYRQFKLHFADALAREPEVSDEDFMAEHEATPEQYELGLTLPGTK